MMPTARRRIVLAQLPIPPVGPQPIRGNVPLAAAYLKMYAAQQGLDAAFDIEILPTRLTNTASDAGLVQAILAADPWLVGFSCYLWNIDRTLWVASRLKAERPELRIMLGGPEVTADNDWVLHHPAVDFAAIGEGEQTFAELLSEMREHEHLPRTIDGLFDARTRMLPPPRRPLPNLNAISSPYLAGILDAAEERMLLLETIRGCVFKCKFCYYPKSYDDLYYVSRDKVLANLAYAREMGVEEVVLLDPTLNQGRNFAEFLELLCAGNPDRQFTYFGELRAEGITPDIARLLHRANFAEVEIGLQSIDPLAMELMDRKNNLKAFERGVQAMLDAGIKVKVDLIIGLPGDTVDSVRRCMNYLRDSRLFTDVQVFNLAILPGTAFRQEAATLGLHYSPRTPYYVIETPTLTLTDMYLLMAEAEELFEREFDPLPEPELPDFTSLTQSAPTTADKSCSNSRELMPIPAYQTACLFADDPAERVSPAPAAKRALAYTVWFRGADLLGQSSRICAEIRRLLAENPHTTLQVVLEPTGDPRTLSGRFLAEVMAACQAAPSYLDRFYSVLPGRPKGAKRILVLVPAAELARLDDAWLTEIEEFGEILAE